MNQEISVLPDAERLAATAAELIERAAAAAIAARSRFTLVLSGGHTPAKTYALLAAPDRGTRIDWSKTWLFFGDERFVPPTNPRSNFQMAQDALLGRAPIAADHVLAVPTDRATAAAAATAYAEQLASFFAQPLDGPPPAFDLILLGLGDDGHTASLFPGAAALDERRAWVTASPPGVLPPPVDRITMTFAVLNAARHVVFLVAGAGKAEPLRDVLENHAPADRRPAAGVQPRHGTLTWLVDTAAARLLQTK